MRQPSDSGPRRKAAVSVAILLASILAAPATGMGQESTAASGWQELAAQSGAFYTQGDLKKAVEVGKAAVLAAEAEFGSHSVQVVSTLRMLGDMCREKDDIPAARDFYQQAARLVEADRGLEHPEAMAVANGLGIVFFTMGDMAAAEMQYSTAVAALEKMLGPSDPRYCEYLLNIGLVFNSGNDAARAGRFYALAVAALETAGLTETPDYGSAQNNLGYVLLDAGRYGEAEKYLLVARNAFARSPGKESFEYAAALNNLARLYGAMGKFDLAVPAVLESLEAMGKAVGTEHAHYATAMDNVASVYVQEGDWKQAKEWCERVEELRGRILPPDDPDLAVTLSNLGTVYLNLGQYKEARDAMERAVAIRRKTPGGDLANPLNSLANLYIATGEYAKADEAFLEALQQLESTVGREHPDYAATLANQARLRMDEGKLQASVDGFQAAAHILERIVGPEHPLYVTCLHNLGAVLYQAGDYAASERYYLEALAQREKLFGRVHLETATSIAGLGILYHEMGEYERAIRFGEEALDVYRRTVGEENSYVSAALSNLGGALASRREFDKAEALLTEAVRIEERLVGPWHMDLVPALKKLAFLEKERGRHGRAREYLERARGIAGMVFGSGHKDYAVTSIDIGLTLAREGKAKEAEEECVAHEKWHRTRALHCRAMAAVARGDLETAGARFREALAEIDDVMAAALSYSKPEHVANVLDSYTDVYVDYLGLLMRCAASGTRGFSQGPGREAERFLAGFSALHARTYKLLGGMTRLALSSKWDEYRRIGERVVTADMELSSGSRPIPAEEREHKEQALLELRGHQDRVWQEMLESDPGLAGTLRAFDETLAQQVCAALPERGLFLLYAPVELPFSAAAPWRPGAERERVYLRVSGYRETSKECAWALANVGTESEVLAALARTPVLFDLPADGQAWTDAVLGPEELDQRLPAAARVLYGGIEGPWSAAAFVVFSGQGLFAEANLAAWRPARGERFLFEDKTLVSVATAEDFVRSVEGGNAEKPLRALQRFADIDYAVGTAAGPTAAAAGGTSVGGGSARDLPDAAGDSRSRCLLSFLPLSESTLSATLQALSARTGVTVETTAGDRATEASFVEALQSGTAGVVHADTHSTVLDEGCAPGGGALGLMFRQVVAFAGVNARFAGSGPAATAPDDGALTAFEVMKLRLRRGLDLLVLASCDSGRAGPYSWEGASGFRRAMMVVGVRSLLVSLRPVDDRFSNAFFAAFYEKLLGRMASGADMGRFDAYRAALLAARSPDELKACASLSGNGWSVREFHVESLAHRKFLCDSYYGFEYSLIGEWR